jgi:hypothetical protein
MNFNCLTYEQSILIKIIIQTEFYPTWTLSCKMPYHILSVCYSLHSYLSIDRYNHQRIIENSYRFYFRILFICSKCTETREYFHRMIHYTQLLFIWVRELTLELKNRRKAAYQCQSSSLDLLIVCSRDLFFCYFLFRTCCRRM